LLPAPKVNLLYTLSKTLGGGGGGEKRNWAKKKGHDREKKIEGSVGSKASSWGYHRGLSLRPLKA